MQKQLKLPNLRADVYYYLCYVTFIYFYFTFIIPAFIYLYFAVRSVILLIN